ncbi:MAG: PAS domain S-box protein [Bacteroidales bacterium]|nr:PAS domain S-box protein [Bacteroidales bacterium]
MAPLRETILAVDDNPVNIKMLYEMLNGDYNFISTLDGTDAITKASEHHPDLILLDIMMPGKDGFEVCRELKANEHTANIPVIFLTARSDKESMIEGLKAGAVDYISKPFRREELECRIKNHIDLVKSQNTLRTELYRRNLAQKQLSEKTRLLSLVTDNINDAVFVCTSDGSIILASAAVKKIFGLESSSIIGKKIWTIAYYDDENKIIQQYFQQVLNGGETVGQFAFHDLDMVVAVIESHASIVNYSESEPKLVVIDANDITDRAKSVSRFKRNMKLQNNLRLITVEVSHISKIRKCMAYLTEALFKITKINELALLLGRADNRTEYYYINSNNEHCRYGLLPNTTKDYSKVTELLRDNETEIISNIQASQIPSDLARRNHRFIIYPIKIESQIAGAFYIGKNDKTSIQQDTIYSIVTVAGLIKNIINKNSFEQRIRSREQELHQLFESSANAIVILDNKYQIARHNSRFTEMFNLKQGYYSKHNIKTLIKGEAINDLTQLLNRTLANGHYEVAEFPFTANDGSKRFYEATCSRTDVGSSTLWMLIITDITKLKDVDRAIFSTITTTEERERTRMAMELHDGIGALLSSINIYINLILSGEMEKNEMLNTLSLTKSLVDEAIQSAKEIANNLHPVILTRFGLVATIKSFIEQIESAGIIKVDFSYKKFLRLNNKNLELTLYRIIHELINNTLKYAKAHNIVLSLSTLPRSIQLEYADDGIGVDTAAATQKKSGMGMSNIEGRIKALNGTCNFQTKPQKGFRVFIEIPYIATENNIDTSNIIDNEQQN